MRHRNVELAHVVHLPCRDELLVGGVVVRRGAAELVVVVVVVVVAVTWSCRDVGLYLDEVVKL